MIWIHLDPYEISLTITLFHCSLHGYPEFFLYVSWKEATELFREVKTAGTTKFHGNGMWQFGSSQLIGFCPFSKTHDDTLKNKVKSVSKLYKHYLQCNGFLFL